MYCLHSKTSNNECTHVWLRIDRIRKPLDAHYTGHVFAVKRYHEVFVIENFAGNKLSR